MAMDSRRAFKRAAMVSASGIRSFIRGRGESSFAICLFPSHGACSQPHMLQNVSKTVSFDLHVDAFIQFVQKVRWDHDALRVNGIKKSFRFKEGQPGNRYVNICFARERQAPAKTGSVAMTFTLLGMVAAGDAPATLAGAAFAAAALQFAIVRLPIVHDCSVRSQPRLL